MSFIGVSLPLIIAPGPDNIFVMAQSISYGKKEGIATAFGQCSIVTIHTLAASIELSTILYKSDVAFSILKYLGAFYLLYLAYQAFCSSSIVGSFTKLKKHTLPALYRRGFYGMPSSANDYFRFDFHGITLVVFSIIAIFAGNLGEKLLQNEKSSKIINLAQGTIFTGIGLKLFFMNR
ncbi:LysE family translocator [Gottfriedia sp. NPDC057948]|uniref:LysE family translocator n=1 Tax=Gottfriedia sp. NPDC057948 TaxID=3346287 RepID=UPI0036DABE42